MIDDIKLSDTSVRIYLIAHAPAKPWAGWQAVMPPKPERDLQPDKEGRPQVANAKEIEAWQKEYSKQVAIQWPIAWADAIIEQLKRKP